MLLFFEISCLLNAILSFILGFFTLYKNRKSKVNILWFWVSVSIGVWSFGISRIVVANSYQSAWIWNWVLYSGAIFIPVFYLHFIVSFLKILSSWSKILIKIGYCLSAIFFVANFSPYFVKDVPPVFIFKHWVSPGLLYYPYFIYFIIYLSLSLYLLVNQYRLHTGVKRQQIKYLLISGVLGVGGGVTVFFPQLIGMYPFGSYFIILYLVGVTYAIAKYRLMDIRLVISKSILYFILIGTVTLAFTSITFITGQVFTTEGFSTTLISIFISLIIVLGLDPLKRFLARITDKVFYKDKIDYQEVLKQLGFIIAKEIELKRLFIDLSVALEKLLKCKNVNFLYQNTVTGMYKGFESGDIFFTKNDEIIDYLKNNKKIVVVEELDRVAKEQGVEIEKQKLLSIVERLDKMKIGLISPIISNNQVTALLCIDKKLSGDTFSGDDINLISVLTPQIATALEKSKLYNEIQDLNLHLQEKVEEATLNLRQANIDLETRNKYLTALQKISGVITRSLNFKEVTSFIANSIKTEMGFGAGVINFIDEKSKSIFIGAMTYDEEIKKITDLLPKKPSEYKVSFSDRENLAIKAMNSGNIEKSSFVYDVFKPAITKEQVDKMQKLLNIKSAVSVPMYSENKIIGSIDFFLYKDIPKIRKVDIEVMKALTDQTGLVIKNINLYKELMSKNKELEQANVHLQQLDKAKSEFLSIASHQLRTPLTGIKGYLSMILEGDFGKFTQKQTSVLKDVFLASDRMTKLVNVFLNVSRIESGRLKLDLQEVEISDIIKKSIEDLESNAKTKEIKLSFEDLRNQKEKIKIKLDSDKIKDVLLNLIDNAIKYTTKGLIKVELSSDSQNLIIKIKDTGIGLDKDEIERLFSKFSRGTDSARINTDGSGLGLYIARKMIEIHNGKIWVQSDGKGKGSTFQFTIPKNLN